jgi:hypothetical protein
VNALNARGARPENIDRWSQLVIKHTGTSIEQVSAAPRSGIWRMQPDGRAVFNRMDTHRRAVESENEAFFLRITGVGDYLYEGADMGILVMRDRLMTKNFELTDRAQRWIDAMRAQYRSAELGSQLAITSQIQDGPGFKMM